MSYIEFKNVNKEYYIDQEINQALSNVSFKIKKGELALIKGSNGSGKTSILNLLAGFDKVTNGEVIVDKINLEKLSDKKVSKYIRDYVGFVFDGNELIDDMTILENIILSLNISKKVFDTENYIGKLGFDKKLNYFPIELTDSEKIKASLLRAICKEPKILLCDEILLKMTEKDRRQVVKVLKELANKKKITVIITSDNTSISSFVNKTILLNNGKVESLKTPRKGKVKGTKK